MNKYINSNNNIYKTEGLKIKYAILKKTSISVLIEGINKEIVTPYATLIRKMLYVHKTQYYIRGFKINGKTHPLCSKDGILTDIMDISSMLSNITLYENEEDCTDTPKNFIASFKIPSSSEAKSRTITIDNINSSESMKKYKIEAANTESSLSKFEVEHHEGEVEMDLFVSSPNDESPIPDDMMEVESFSTDVVEVFSGSKIDVQSNKVSYYVHYIDITTNKIDAQKLLLSVIEIITEMNKVCYKKIEEGEPYVYTGNEQNLLK